MSSSLKLVRFESTPEVNTAVFLIEIKQEANIDIVINFKNIDKNLSITFLNLK